MKGNIMLREVEEKDRRIFIELMSKFYQTPAVNSVIDVKNHEKSFQHIIDGNPLVDAYMIEKDKETIGYVLLANSYSNEIADTVVWIEHIYILDQYQNLGFGEKIMNELHALYQDKAKAFRLEVSNDNKELMNFYQRHGYSERNYLQMHKYI